MTTISTQVICDRMISINEVPIAEMTEQCINVGDVIGINANLLSEDYFYNVTAPTTEENYFFIEGDVTLKFPIGATFVVTGSTGGLNDGTYTVNGNAFYAGGATGIPTTVLPPSPGDEAGIISTISPCTKSFSVTIQNIQTGAVVYSGSDTTDLDSLDFNHNQTITNPGSYRITMTFSDCYGRISECSYDILACGTNTVVINGCHSYTVSIGTDLTEAVDPYFYLYTFDLNGVKTRVFQQALLNEATQEFNLTTPGDNIYFYEMVYYDYILDAEYVFKSALLPDLCDIRKCMIKLVASLLCVDCKEIPCAQGDTKCFDEHTKAQQSTRMLLNKVTALMDQLIQLLNIYGIKFSNEEVIIFDDCLLNDLGSIQEIISDINKAMTECGQCDDVITSSDCKNC